MDDNLFIAKQYYDDMNDDFVVAAAQECMRHLPHDFYTMDNYCDFYKCMQSYLMK